MGGYLRARNAGDDVIFGNTGFGGWAIGVDQPDDNAAVVESEVGCEDFRDGFATDAEVGSGRCDLRHGERRSGCVCGLSFSFSFGGDFDLNSGGCGCGGGRRRIVGWRLQCEDRSGDEAADGGKMEALFHRIVLFAY